LGSVVLLQILSITILFRISTRLSDVLVRATGDVYSRAWRRSVSGVIMLISCYLGQMYAGVEGVAWAVVFTSMITFILMANLTFKHINYNWIDYLKLHEKGMLVSLISGLILFTIKTGIKQFVMNNNGILFGTLFLFIPIFILL